MADLYTGCDCDAGNAELVHTVGCAATPICSAWPTIVSGLMRNVVMPLELDENQQEQFDIYMEAFALFIEREAKYHSLWKQYGATDSYQHMRSKFARSGLLLTDPVPEGQDDPLDLINYTAFFLRNLRAGRMTNTTECHRSGVIATVQEDIKAGDTIVIDLSTGKAVRA